MISDTSRSVVACDQGPIGFEFPVYVAELTGRNPDELKDGEDALKTLFTETGVTAPGWRMSWPRILSMRRVPLDTKTRLNRRMISFEVTAQAA